MIETERAPRLDWSPILTRAAAIVREYDTGVTLRQLFYRLVATQVLPNTQNAYKSLSKQTAKARREGWFPSLIDLTRSVRQRTGFDDPTDFLVDMARGYTRSHDEGQRYSIYLGVEKNGMIAQLTAWFGEYGVAILALGGYASQTFKDSVRRHIEYAERPSVLLYAGDFDPSGEDIDRDFVEQVGNFGQVRRIALSSEQVDEYGLPPAPGKATDSRAGAFIARHGKLVQVELDALDPNDLQALYRDAFNEFWDEDEYQATLDLETEEREALIARARAAS